MTTCTCPKCKAEFDFDVAAVTDEGAFHKCPACNSNIAIRKESFAQRALYRSEDISCAECGNPPGLSTYCENCHAIYPDILIIETSSAVKKFIASFKRAKVKKAAETTGRDFSSVTTASGRGTAEVKQPPKKFPLAIILVLIIAAMAAGGYFWYQNKIESQYAQHFVKTMLALKTARDVELRISNRVMESWQAGTSHILSGEEQKTTASASKDVNTLMTLIVKVPEKFKASNDGLKKLHESFGKLHEAVNSPLGTAEIYNGAVTKSDGDFMKIARQLQSGLPEKIAAIYSVSKKKYKTLQDI